MRSYCRTPLRISLLFFALSSSSALLSACRQSQADQEQQGSGHEPSASAPNWEVLPAEPAKSAKFEDQDFALEVGRAEACHTSGVLAPSAGQSRFALPIKLEALAQRAIPLSPFEFALEDKDGHVYRPTLASCRATLSRQELKPGHSLNFFVAFDVPTSEQKQDVVGMQLVFEPFLLGRKRVQARARVPE